MNGFSAFLVNVARVLVAAAICGGVVNAIAQSEKNAQIQANKEELQERRIAVAAIPVIKTDIEYMKGDLGEVKEDISKIEEAITKLAEKED